MKSYKLALVTNGYKYYVNTLEDDENKAVIMKDKDNKTISNNYFAYADFIEQMENIIEKSATYQYIDEGILEQVKEIV